MAHATSANHRVAYQKLTGIGDTLERIANGAQIDEADIGHFTTIREALARAAATLDYDIYATNTVPRPCVATGDFVVWQGLVGQQEYETIADLFNRAEEIRGGEAASKLAGLVKNALEYLDEHQEIW